MAEQEKPFWERVGGSVRTEPMAVAAQIELLNLIIVRLVNRLPNDEIQKLTQWLSQVKEVFDENAPDMSSTTEREHFHEMGLATQRILHLIHVTAGE